MKQGINAIYQLFSYGVYIIMEVKRKLYRGVTENSSLANTASFTSKNNLYWINDGVMQNAQKHFYVSFPPKQKY